MPVYAVYCGHALNWLTIDRPTGPKMTEASCSRPYKQHDDFDTLNWLHLII
jgi:hypothetical protein